MFSLSMCLTSCEGALDDVLGEWSRPTPGNNTPSGGGSDSGGGSSTVAVTSVTLNEAYLRFDKNVLTAQTLTATVAPDDATDKTVTWESSDESVATVDENGQVTPITKGTVTITATANDGSGMKATSTVIVYDKIVDISAFTGYVTAGESWLIKGDATTPVNKMIIINNGATVTLNGINITNLIHCSDNATIILADGSTNTVTNTNPMPGIQIGGSGTTLTIDAESAGTGTLDVTGSGSAAGIGTNQAFNGTKTGGNIVINGGTVTAKGGSNAAGIGTGCSYKDTTNPTSNKCGDITIGAGVKSVTATKGTGSTNSIGIGASVGGGTQTCGKIKFGTAEVYDGGGDWTTYNAMTAGTYGGLKLAISGDDWTLTPVAP